MLHSFCKGDLSRKLLDHIWSCHCTVFMPSVPLSLKKTVISWQVLCVHACMCVVCYCHVSNGMPDFVPCVCLCPLRKALQAEQREYKKKKAQKKVQRMKELEQEREDQKSKWQQFNNKAYSKNKKGQVSNGSLGSVLLNSPASCNTLPWPSLSTLCVFSSSQVKRSIFASPESVNGKVGVGTCGIADKPMTQYNDTSKYNVRHLMPQWGVCSDLCSPHPKRTAGGASNPGLDTERIQLYHIATIF